MTNSSTQELLTPNRPQAHPNNNLYMNVGNTERPAEKPDVAKSVLGSESRTRGERERVSELFHSSAVPANDVIKDPEEYYDDMEEYCSDEEEGEYEYVLSEEDLKGIVKDDLDSTMGMDDPDRMKLSSDELDWTLDIRAALEADPDLDNLPDLMYSQLAIICNHADMGRAQGISEALRRARGLQEFRQEFEIADTYEEGCRVLRAFVELFPKCLLSWSFSQPDGTWVSAFDLAKQDVTLLTTEVKLKSFCAGMYYMLHAMSPDVETIRKGPIMLFECGESSEASFRTSFKIWFRVADKLTQFYPELRLVKHYHTSTFFNAMVSLGKKTLVPKVIAERMEVGLAAENRLDDLFLVPDAQAATERALNGMTECLKRRYDNEKQFYIPQPSIQKGT